MPESPQPISILDARLAEIDRRLGAIQTGLADGDAEAAGGDAKPAASAAPAPGLPPRVPVRESAAPAPPRPAGIAPARPGDPGPAPPEAAELIAELRQLAATQARLLDSLGELVSAYQRGLAPPLRAPALAPLPNSPTHRNPQTPQTPQTMVGELTVSAGPLASTEALHGFERTLSRIPEVRRVEVRGYEGGDRAIVDVQLFDPTS